MPIVECVCLFSGRAQSGHRSTRADAPRSVHGTSEVVSGAESGQGAPVLFGAPTWGHNTNNLADSSNRTLKDVVPCRHKTYNAAALADLVTDSWEPHFSRNNLIDHTHNRAPAHEL